MKDIKDRLIELRELHQLTKADMAKKLQLNKSTITRYENGEMKPTVDVLITMAKVFGVSIDWLVGFDVEEERKYDPIVRECIEYNISTDKLKQTVDFMKDWNK